jgi:hypothetical protein
MNGYSKHMLSRVSRQAIGIARRILTEYLRQRRTLIFWAAFPVLILFRAHLRKQSIDAGKP